MYSISQSQDGGFVVAGNDSYNFDDDYVAKLKPEAPPAGPAGPDLIIRDTPLDTGLEPNPDTVPMWVSSDIWVRLLNDNGLVHQNPEYSAGISNWVYNPPQVPGDSSVQPTATNPPPRPARGAESRGSE